MRLPTFQLNTLQWALGVSLGLHAVLLTVRFVAPEAFDRAFRDTPLEVILVNARSEEDDARDEDAQAIAQSKLAGGGELETGRATSPLPATQIDLQGDTLDQETSEQLQRLQAQQNLLLAQVRAQLASLPAPAPQSEAAGSANTAQEEKRRLLLKQLAEIERRIQQDSARPRKHYIGPATREAAYAQYYDRLRRAIEAKGTANFPNVNGRKLYGELTMALTVDTQGRIVSAEVAQSSGDRELDRRAQAIAQAASPFGSFTPAMRKQADQIVVVSRFRFAHDATLQTQVSNAPAR
ncbi:energy transducer TonB [Hylemonella gracilis str. Niagara R]|uniref:Energy transducer TonB n=1 Tax=Hylemonella gracilis str. Niagara R TaxID=1458275 RepID=A0A016XL95_9BURK|nr:TonB family protein [Hylemonella gracilis]EYC52357.1 energy transducer TonB [Hylemonella gracilis str. Niagara R]